MRPPDSTYHPHHYDAVEWCCCCVVVSPGFGRFVSDSNNNANSLRFDDSFFWYLHTCIDGSDQMYIYIYVQQGRTWHSPSRSWHSASHWLPPVALNSLLISIYRNNNHVGNQEEPRLAGSWMEVDIQIIRTSFRNVPVVSLVLLKSLLEYYLWQYQVLVVEAPVPLCCCICLSFCVSPKRAKR